MGAVLPKLAALLRLEKEESGFIEGGGSRKKIRHIAFVGDDLQLMHGSLEVAAEWEEDFRFSRSGRSAGGQRRPASSST